MATLKLKYINSWCDGDGRWYHYFRHGKIRVRLPGAPGTRTFSEEYDRLLAKHGLGEQSTRRHAPEGTLRFVINRYLESEAFKNVKPSTQIVYRRHMDWLREHYGDAEFASIEERHVRKIRNELKDRPSVADYTVDKINMLWRFAKESLEMTLGPNPAREVAAIHTKHEPHKAWPPELCEAIEAHPNPAIVRAYYLLRYTGQRRSDVVKMHRSQFDGTAIELTQEKTGTNVWLPCPKRLRDHFQRTGIDGEYLLIGSRGGPFRATSLTNMICKACSALGYAGYSPHGLRHLAGSALAEAGCSPHEIMAILGHLTESEANDYVKQAKRRVMAASAMRKLDAYHHIEHEPSSGTKSEQK